MRKSPTKPKKRPLTKTCKKCGLDKPHHWMNTAGRYRHRCHDCHSEYNRLYRMKPENKRRHAANVQEGKQKRKRTIKTHLVESKGGQCRICGLKDKCLSVYDFHHRDPKQKDKNIKICQAEYLTKQLLREVGKCDLLCANCHRRVHWVE